MKGQLTMPARPARANRLAQLMDERRLQLGLKWTQVAERAGAGLSAETLRAIRRGEQAPRPLTRAAIDRALQWAPGSTDRILEHDSDGEPEPMPDAVQPVTIAPEDLSGIMRRSDRDGNLKPWAERRRMMIAWLTDVEPGTETGRRGESA
jgi:hypothetical protein